MHCRIAHLKEEALLRVHRARLRRRNVELVGIEHLGAIHKRAVKDGRLLDGSERTHIDHLLNHPTLCRHVADSIAARLKHCALRFVRAAASCKARRVTKHEDLDRVARASSRAHWHRCNRGGAASRLELSHRLLDEVTGDRSGRRVLKEQGKRERQVGHRGEAI